MEKTYQRGSERDTGPALALWEPYREHRPLRSAGRISLTGAFSEYMALTAGMSPEDIASAFDDTGDVDDRSTIEREIRFLAEIFVDGRIKTFSRLVGGGDPIEMRASAWEIDDPIPRFATGLFNADLAHDPSAAVTHWIFVDSGEWNAAMDGLRNNCLELIDDPEDVSSKPENTVTTAHSATTAPAAELKEESTQKSDLWRSEILPLDSVVEITGLKRSTIYAKVAAGSFPRQIAIHGSRKGWRRGAVQDWLDTLAS